MWTHPSVPVLFCGFGGRPLGAPFALRCCFADSAECAHFGFRRHFAFLLFVPCCGGSIRCTERPFASAVANDCLCVMWRNIPRAKRAPQAAQCGVRLDVACAQGCGASNSAALRLIPRLSVSRSLVGRARRARRNRGLFSSQPVACNYGAEKCFQHLLAHVFGFPHPDCLVQFLRETDSGNCCSAVGVRFGECR